MTDHDRDAHPTDTEQGLTHLRADGSAHMVDVTDKAVTKRTARTEAYLVTRPDVVQRLMEGSLPKGEALGTARIAGIMAAKRTWELVPLCHPLPLTKLAIDFEAVCGTGAAIDTGADTSTSTSPGTGAPDRVRIIATVTTKGVTGVEMEALTAASVAALTLYDMIKAVDKHAVIDGLRVLAKSGGKSGDWELR
ncbi:cyclic pyranopterin monophosphate synthase MoaC [Leucobacter sp. GX24907]